MQRFTADDDLSGAEFRDTRLRGARFHGADLSGVVMRGVEVEGVDIDSPWLPHTGPLLVNGVDVAPFVEAELDRRFPGRAQRTAETPEDLRAAWAALEGAWADAVERAAGLPVDVVEQSVAGEWSFAQTLRHLVLATDLWFRKTVLEVDAPFHAFGLAHSDDQPGDGPLAGVAFTDEHPSFAAVLEARADRQGEVRAFLADVTTERLDEPRPNPWAPDHEETVRTCLHTVLEEEWEHLRYALRDLDTLTTAPAPAPTD